MKKTQMLLGMVFAAAVSLGVGSGQPSAATYTPDDFLFSEDLSSSSVNSEQSALADFLNVSTSSLALVERNDNPSASVDDAGNFFLDVSPDEPSYFALKFGTGSTSFDDTYFFSNIAELTKLVWTATQVNGLSLDRLSHYTTFVPLPAAAWLFLSALAGLFGLKRWRRGRGEGLPDAVAA